MSDLRSRLVALLQQSPAPLAPLHAREIVIYGAGNSGRTIAAAANRRGISVRCFLDARAASMEDVDGCPCYAPETAEARRAANESLPVIVAIFNYTTDTQPVFTLLKQIGFQRVLSFYEAHELLELEPQFWLTRRSFYADREAEIVAGFDLFEDELSQQVYYDHLALRLTFDVSLLREPDHQNQYLARDLPSPRVPMRLVDGGAFNGDTVRAMLDHGISLEAIAAFEPDPHNFRDLGTAVAEVARDVREAILFPCGLAEASGVRQFASGSGAASSLDSGGDTHVQVVALDDVLPNFAPTFVKLDIEGVEPQALEGATRLISRFQPTLAVCVYHAPEHLWTLPALIRHRWPDYRLALRAHQFNGFDVVAYALPR